MLQQSPTATLQRSRNGAALRRYSPSEPDISPQQKRIIGVSQAFALCVRRASCADAEGFGGVEHDPSWIRSSPIELIRILSKRHQLWTVGNLRAVGNAGQGDPTVF